MNGKNYSGFAWQAVSLTIVVIACILSLNWPKIILIIHVE
jgi:heme exporter protein D